MPTARRRRTISAIALSAAVHAVVLTVVWLQKPTLSYVTEPAGPPEAVIPVLILPRAPPPAAGAAAPAPIRLHRRSQRFAAEPPPVTPLVVREAESPMPAPPAPHPDEGAPAQPLMGSVRNALRLGPVGCANAEAAGLSREERDACDRQLAAGAKEAPFIPSGMSSGKLKSLATAAEVKEENWRYRAANLPPGIGPDGPLGPPTDTRGSVKTTF